MSWKDEEIDMLFGEAADQQVFEYRPEYWKDIEKQLPINKNYKRPLWWWSASVFVVSFLGLMFVEFPENKENNDLSESNRSTRSNSTTTKRELNYKRIVSSIESKVSAGFVKSKGIQNEKFNESNVTKSADMDNEDLYDEVKTIEFKNSKTPNSIGIEEEDISGLTQIDKANERFNIENSFLKNDLCLSLRTIVYLKPTPQLLTSKNENLKAKLSTFYIEFNGGIGQSWSKQNEDFRSVNGFTGLSFGYSFPINRFLITSGIGVQATKFNNLEIMDRTKIYGFGSSILENSYEFSLIYSLSIPIGIHYIKGRHSFNAGINTSVNILTRLKHSQNIDGNRTLYSSGVSGVSFFNRFGLQPAVGYSFYINEKTQFGARFQLQLIEPLKSNRFIGTHQKIPFDGQIYLRRTLDF